MRSHGIKRSSDAEIGLVISIQRSGHTDDHHIHLRDLAVIGSGAKSALLSLLDFGAGNANDVGPTGVQRIYFLPVNVKACNPKPLLTEEQGQGQTDITTSR